MVQWFSNELGYGYIKNDGGGNDVFVHHSAILMDGYRTLTEKDIVSFEISEGTDGRIRAIDVFIIESAEVAA